MVYPSTQNLFLKYHIFTSMQHCFLGNGSKTIKRSRNYSAQNSHHCLHLKILIIMMIFVFIKMPFFFFFSLTLSWQPCHLLHAGRRRLRLLLRGFYLKSPFFLHELTNSLNWQLEITNFCVTKFSRGKGINIKTKPKIKKKDLIFSNNILKNKPFLYRSLNSV